MPGNEYKVAEGSPQVHTHIAMVFHTVNMPGELPMLLAWMFHRTGYEDCECAHKVGPSMLRGDQVSFRVDNS